MSSCVTYLPRFVRSMQHLNIIFIFNKILSATKTSRTFPFLEVTQGEAVGLHGTDEVVAFLLRGHEATEQKEHRNLSGRPLRKRVHEVRFDFFFFSNSRVGRLIVRFDCLFSF